MRASIYRLMSMVSPPTHSSHGSSISYSSNCREEYWRRLLMPLTIWICVSVILRYGYYGDCRMVLGPSSSRLMKASSVFVEQVEISDEDNKGVFLYGFAEKPELSLETNWSVSNYMIVTSYSRKGFSLWLNKGSRIRMRWEAQISTLNQLQLVMLKGERKYETLLPELTSFSAANSHGEPIYGKEVEYTIDEDDKYFLGLLNTNSRSIIMAMTVNVTSKKYDLSKAKNVCSAIKGSCRLRLLFPKTHYVVVTTPDSGGQGDWYVELSFVARVLTYIAILGFLIIVIFLVLKYLGACDNDTTITETVAREVQVHETLPIFPVKHTRSTYGTNEEHDNDDDDGSSSSSSEELYDAKLCVICYDEQRNCFIVPCGHCATCYDCAQRIMEGENKICPICRRIIHKVRRLFSP